MIRNAEPQDVEYVAAHMRREDEEEVRSIAGLSPLQALSIGLIHSNDCITGVSAGGEPVLMAGVVPLKSTGSIWMLCTPSVFHNVRELITTARLWVDAMVFKYGHVSNFVDSRNDAHLRFVRHMGFSLGDPIENYGPGSVSVIPINRGTRNV